MNMCDNKWIVTSLFCMGKKKHKHHKPVHRRLNPFDDIHNKFFVRANTVLAIMTLVSVATVALETVQSLQRYNLIFTVVEWTAVVLFSAEYIARLYLTTKPLRYIFSFFGIIDLVAILPSIFGLANLTFLKSARTIRIIRLLRMMRLAKFSRAKDKQKVTGSLYKINLQIYFITLSLAVLVIGSMFYLFENVPESKDIPSGMYWALKSILGGFPYPQPESLGGIIALVLARFTSMILLGMMLGLVGMMIRKLLIGSESDK